MHTPPAREGATKASLPWRHITPQPVFLLRQHPQASDSVALCRMLMSFYGSTSLLPSLGVLFPHAGMLLCVFTVIKESSKCLRDIIYLLQGVESGKDSSSTYIHSYKTCNSDLDKIRRMI